MLKGRKALYVGETSRYPYQRGREHCKEVEDAKKSHPMIIHFSEKHEGCRQEIVMRTIKETRTALERQAWESVAIERLARDPENLKNQWSWSKKPALTGKERERTLGSSTGKEESGKRGKYKQ